jgi:hypothetical protein
MPQLHKHFYVSGNAMEIVIINQRYSMNVWITSILSAPFILIVFLAVQERTYWNVGFISLYILSVFVGVILALPSIFLHKLAFKELAANIKSVMLLKILLSIISICTLAFTYVVIERFTHSGYGNDTIIPLFCFLGTVIISSLIYRVQAKEALPIT